MYPKPIGKHDQSAADSNQPRWIAKMYPGKTGRDHLGLGSVSSDQILPDLSPSINVLTIHPRYHSFYAFLLDEYWQRIPEKSLNLWKGFYRPHEYIFSLGVYLHTGTHGAISSVVGGLKTGPLAQQDLKSYPSQYDYIDSDLGGYGLYYRSVMAEMELIYPGGPGFPTPVDVPSELGRKFAAAFRTAIENTEYYKKYFRHTEDKIPTNVIKEYIEHACLCRLKDPNAPDHDILLQSFLQGGTEKNSTARTGTFRLFLDLAKQTDGSPIHEDRFRELIYFQQTEDGLSYKPKPELMDVYVRWRFYQMREYYSFALNALWRYLCEWGITEQGDLQPTPLSKFWEHLDTESGIKQLLSELGFPKTKLSSQTSVVEALDWLRKTSTSNKNHIERSYDRQARINEHSLYTYAASNPYSSAVVPAMTFLLLLTFLRLEDQSLPKRPEWEINRMGFNGRLSVDRYVRQMKDFLRSGAVTISEFLRWIFQDYIIIQHQGVATSKLPENTFRFQRQGDSLRFYQHDNFVSFMNSRFEAIATHVYELGLCGDLKSEEHGLTLEGEKLLFEGTL